MRRTALVILCVLVLASSTSAFGKTAFSGSYAVSGMNPGVGGYKGTLTISARGEVYDVYWQVGNQQYAGIGIANGDTLSIAYTGGDRTWFGVITYRQRADGTLEGKWVVAGGKAKPGTETAVRK